MLVHDFLPCPFCGGTNTVIHKNPLWSGMSKDILSVSIRHWCIPIQGQPTRMIERIGRDMESAIKMWNMRT